MVCVQFAQLMMLGCAWYCVFLCFQWLYNTVPIIDDGDQFRMPPQKRKIHQFNHTNSESFEEILDSLSVLTEGTMPNNDTPVNCPAPLVFVHDIVRFSSGHAEDRRIPKIFHMSYKNRCLPQDLASIYKRWSQALPSYSIFFHDDEAIQKLLNEEWPEFPHLHEVSKCIKYKGAMLVDLWRMLVLYKYGGIYSDIDVIPTIHYPEDLIEPNVSGLILTDAWKRPFHSFLALEPKHPIAFHTIAQILTNLLEMPNIARPKLVFVTGPHALRAGYQKYAYKVDHNAIFHGNDDYITGLQNKTIKKIGKKRSIKYITVKLGWAELVPHPHNSTLMIPRQDRIEIEGGIVYWVKEVYREGRKNKSVSCKYFLSNE